MMTIPASVPDDTQWARYEVFQQSRPGSAFANVGSVHAPDAEMALQNARDVFVRRPQTYRLWVVPAEAILMCTAEQLEREQWSSAEDNSKLRRRFHVFQKQSQRRSMTYVTQTGEVQASSATEALHLALQQFGDEKPTYVWWIVPHEAIVSTEEEDAPNMFEPAHDKQYRMPTEYRTQTMMRELEEREDDV